MSRFSKLRQDLQQPQIQEQPTEDLYPSPSQATELRLAEEEKPRGRLKKSQAKSANPDYTQVMSYIPKQTHRQVKMALLQQEQKQDFSELVESLLQQWLKENQLFK